jgi:DNA polymerase III delta prime subunit
LDRSGQFELRLQVTAQELCQWYALAAQSLLMRLELEP